MLRDLRWVSVTETLSRLASFITVPLLTRAFQPSSYGLYKSIFFLVSLILLIQGSTNLKFLVQKYIPSADDRQRGGIISAVLVVTVLILILCVLLLMIGTYSSYLVLISPELQKFVSKNLLILSLLVVTTPTYQIGTAILRSLDRFQRYSVVKIMNESVFLFTILFLYLSDSLTVRIALLGYLLANIISILITGSAISREILTWPDFHALKEQFIRISAPLVPRTIIVNISEKVPDAVVLTVFGTAIYGKWTVIFIFVTVMTVLSQPFSTILLPKLSNRIENGEPLDPVLLRYYRVLGILVVPAVVGGWILGPDIIHQAFGKEYLYAQTVVGILITAFGIQVLNTVSGHFFIATGKSSYETYNRILGGAVRVVFALVGAFVLESLLVIALGFVLEQVVISTFSIWYQANWVDFSLPRPVDMGKVSAALVVLATVVISLNSYASSLLYTLSLVGIGAAVYFGILAIVGFFTEDDVALTKRFIGM